MIGQYCGNAARRVALLAALFSGSNALAATALVSGRIPGEAAVSESQRPSVSADGRYVAYESYNEDLVGDDRNRQGDIFIYDRQAGTTERVSISSAGVEANGGSYGASMSADGRFIAFQSTASNLVSGDTNGKADLFVRDRVTRETRRVVVDTVGSPYYGPSRAAISANGRFVVCTSDSPTLVGNDTNGTYDVFVHDLVSGVTERVSVGASGAQANHGASGGAISADGRYVSFTSSSDNLVSNDTSGNQHVFVRDRIGGTTELVSRSTSGAQGNGHSFNASISADGRFVAFASYASNLSAPHEPSFSSNIFVRDRTLGVTEELTSIYNTSEGGGSVPVISSAGRYVAFYSIAQLAPGDNGWAYDTHVIDRQTGTTRRLSNYGDEVWDLHDPVSAFSADERFLAIRVDGQIRLTNLLTGATTAVPAGGSDAIGGAAAADNGASGSGRYVAFNSTVVSGSGERYTSVFVRDTQTGAVESIPAIDGGKPNGSTNSASLSDDGRRVAFASDADNLIAGDDNYEADIFLRDLDSGTVEMINVSTEGVQTNGPSQSPTISADGRFVAYESGDGLRWPRVVSVRDTQLLTTERVSVGMGGNNSNPRSYSPSISGDGRWVAFVSDAQLRPIDLGIVSDIFVRDRSAGTTTRISIGVNGAEPNGYSHLPSISQDGRYVAYASTATNLVPGNPTSEPAVYLRDLVAGTTELISIGLDGRPMATYTQPSIDKTGRYVAFAAYADRSCGSCGTSVFVRDRETRSTLLASVNDAGAAADGESGAPSISADGRRVVFTSSAANLASGDLNGGPDVYVRDISFPERSALRVNAGGGSFTDGQGRFWLADTGFNTGVTSTSSSPIAGTDDDYLYQNQRYDDVGAPDLQYRLPIANGTYQVKLHFAELNANRASNGARVFHVDVEGTRRFSNVDVYREAGAINKALVKTVTVPVTDGAIDIAFRHLTRSPIVNAIEIIAQDGGGSVATVIRTNAGGGEYRDTAGRLWSTDSNFSTGSSSTSTTAIAGTEDDSLYQSIRWDDTPAPELQYSYTVPNGGYSVRLLFTESNSKTALVGARVFDVDIEGVTQINDLDVFAAAGGLNRALSVTRDVTVNDGQMNILFRHQVKNPMVSAIEITSK